MTKHAKKSDHLQAVDLPKTMAVEIPLPLLGAFTNIERSFFELCIDAGQQVLGAMMEQDREDLCGPRWRRDPDRRAGRSGTTRSEVTLGGRRIPIARPRVRSKEGEEVELPSFAFAAKRDPLDRHALNAVACGISSRKYARSLDPLPDEMEERSTSKSSVSRRYVAMTTKQMTSWLTTPLGDRHFPIVMIDGIHLGDHLVLIALGIDTEGKKQVLGLREGDTENGQVARSLLRDLVERGLDPERARLFVIDGAKALTSAIRKMFGPLAKIQRCQIHKHRNILGHLPDRLHESVKAVLREAWSLGDATVAKRRLERLASSLEADHPGAAASVREGLDETLTLQRLGIGGRLYKKLRSTNAIENLNSGIATYSKNVKRWQGGRMVVRWVSAAIVEAEKKFRRVQGWRDIEKLVRALDAVQQKQEATARRVA
ncbi:MAG: IS256 family transposase [Planctomycetes bacterium]|jgi:transposase-like protein|nr:IS256 family transposase [Planctomycetota bacterium]